MLVAKECEIMSASDDGNSVEGLTLNNQRYFLLSAFIVFNMVLMVVFPAMPKKCLTLCDMINNFCA